MANPEKISGLLNLAQQGDHDAENELISLVYEELRIMAHRHLRGEHGALTLSTTVLVNEAYVKLVDAKTPPFVGTSYFFGAAARAMRQVVIDLARIRKTKKHGGDQHRVVLDMDDLAIDECAAELLDLDEALGELAQMDERLSHIVECRFFGGLTDQQTSDIVGVTARTVRRDWRKARAWLYHHMHGQPELTLDAKPPLA